MKLKGENNQKTVFLNNYLFLKISYLASTVLLSVDTGLPICLQSGPDTILLISNFILVRLYRRNHY